MINIGKNNYLKAFNVSFIYSLPLIITSTSLNSKKSITPTFNSSIESAIIQRSDKSDHHIIDSDEIANDYKTENFEGKIHLPFQNESKDKHEENRRKLDEIIKRFKEFREDVEVTIKWAHKGQTKIIKLEEMLNGVLNEEEKHWWFHKQEQFITQKLTRIDFLNTLVTQNERYFETIRHYLKGTNKLELENRVVLWHWEVFEDKYVEIPFISKYSGIYLSTYEKHPYWSKENMEGKIKYQDMKRIKRVYAKKINHRENSGIYIRNRHWNQSKNKYEFEDKIFKKYLLEIDEHQNSLIKK